MFLILLIVFILAFFFPLLWFLFFGLSIYLLLTIKSRHIKILHNEIFILFKNKDESHVKTNVNYSYASQYAFDCGAKNDFTDTLVFTIEVNAEPCLITIQKERNGTTSLNVRNKIDQEREMDILLRNLDNAIEYSKNTRDQ